MPAGCGCPRFLLISKFRQALPGAKHNPVSAGTPLSRKRAPQRYIYILALISVRKQLSGAPPEFPFTLNSINLWVDLYSLYKFFFLQPACRTIVLAASSFLTLKLAIMVLPFAIPSGTPAIIITSIPYNDFATAPYFNWFKPTLVSIKFLYS